MLSSPNPARAIALSPAHRQPPKHFLIGINTPVCLFHPPGEPNEVIEVRSLKAVAWNDKPLTIEGQFKLTSNPEMGVFFAMTNAKPVKA
ncbi:hypothetical protein [Asticcacaulis sp.]|uniref:hypothetical protein n=1 Tax=Asticcacaulis sp. TaxID=1872648 RepID=UPI0031D874CB